MMAMIRDSAQGYILSALAVLVLPIGIFVPKGLAALFVAAAVFTLVAMLADGERKVFHLNGTLKVFAGFLLFACLSSLWSLTPETSIYKAVVLSLSVACGLIMVFSAYSLTKYERDIFEGAMLWGGIFGFALLGIELGGNAKITIFLRHLIGQKINGQGNLVPYLHAGVTVSSLYIWPWAIIVWRKWSWPVVVLLIVSVISVFLISDVDAPMFGILMGVLIATLVFAAPKYAPAAVASLLVVGVVCAPLLPNLILSKVDADTKPQYISASGYHRLIIWHATVEKISGRPILGSGFDTSRAMYNKTQKVRTTRYDKDGKPWWGVTSEPIPLHPHNGILQVWLELGGAGALLLLVLLLLVVRNMQRNASSRLDRAVCFGGFISVLVISSLSYGAWQSWWLATQWFVAAFITAATLVPGETRSNVTDLK